MLGYDETFADRFREFDAAGELFEERRNAFMDVAADMIGSRLPD
jgi:hypothetical protein